MNNARLIEALRKAGWNDVCQIEPIAATGNNRVFRVGTGARDLFVKEYFQHPDDPRDRFGNERAFYDYLWSSGVRRTPEPISWLPEERLAIFEFVPGDKPHAATPELLREAAGFLLEINRHRNCFAARALPVASEACFSLNEHLQCVDRRVKRLESIAPESDAHRKVISFVGDKLTPDWIRLRDVTQVRFEDADKMLPQGEKLLSPSDFGFHNAVVRDDGLTVFFDFEYAGWDDPAKTVCDFFCQPAVPVFMKGLPDFLEALEPDFGGEALRARISNLMPIYQMKWCCIMLNDFLPIGDRRRTFSNPTADEDQRRGRQLEKVIDYHRTVFS